jgi:hypothetical protein
MILLSYLLLGDKEWKGAEIRIFAVYSQQSLAEERKRLYKLITSGRLPISMKNVDIIPHEEDVQIRDIIKNRSENADLTMLGFREEAVKHLGVKVFTKYELPGNILFVSAAEEEQFIEDM